MTTILTDLKEQDVGNAADGRPTHYYEAFARPMRDFSPEVSKRIDYFESSYGQEAPTDGEPASTYQRSMIEAGLPEDAQNISMNAGGAYVASLSDGSKVTVIQDGNHLARSISLEGVDYPVDTPLEAADISGAHAEFIGVQQEMRGKLQRSEAALTYLENPEFSDISLQDMQASLLQILGHRLYDAF